MMVQGNSLGKVSSRSQQLLQPRHSCCCSYIMKLSPKYILEFFLPTILRHRMLYLDILTFGAWQLKTYKGSSTSGAPRAFYGSSALEAPGPSSSSSEAPGPSLGSERCLQIRPLHNTLPGLLKGPNVPAAAGILGSFLRNYVMAPQHDFLYAMFLLGGPHCIIIIYPHCIIIQGVYH